MSVYNFNENETRFVQQKLNLICSSHGFLITFGILLSSLSCLGYLTFVHEFFLLNLNNFVPRGVHESNHKKMLR